VNVPAAVAKEVLRVTRTIEYTDKLITEISAKQKSKDSEAKKELAPDALLPQLLRSPAQSVFLLLRARGLKFKLRFIRDLVQPSDEVATGLWIFFRELLT